MDIRHAVGVKAGVPEVTLAALDDYSTSPLFTARERAALELCERMTRDDREVSDACFARLREHFSETEALDVVAVFTMTVRMVGNISLAAVLLIGAWRVVGGGLELGVLTAFLLYLRRFYDPLDEMAMFANRASAVLTPQVIEELKFAVGR